MAKLKGFFNRILKNNRIFTAEDIEEMSSKEFDRSLNIHVKGIDTKIPNVKNYAYYKNLNDKLDKEVGDFLNNNTINPKLYSNDIRHQYVSALYARNLGQDKAKQLGDLNEAIYLSNTGSGAYDTAVDQLNNEIGRNYAIKYPTISKDELLKLLLKDWNKNSKYSVDKLNNKI